MAKLPNFLHEDRDGNYNIPLYIPTVVRKTNKVSKDTRIKLCEEAGFNVFSIPAKYVSIDLLTDSGTGVISDLQKSMMERGDESYAGADSFYRLKNTINEILGMEYVLPTHQGRGAEKVLDSVLVEPAVNKDRKRMIKNILSKSSLSDNNIISKFYDVIDSKGEFYPEIFIPGNTHFDTTVGNILYSRAKPVDLVIDESKDIDVNHPFKGNIDIKKLNGFIDSVIDKYGEENIRDHIPYVLLTITCNSGGGQPVSMKNIKETSAICKKYGLMLIFDVARYAENSYFIKEREDGYSNKSIKDIIKEMFSYADACYMSSKKDGIVPMGGFIATRHEDLYEKCSNIAILFEGFKTYGGMSGMMMEALAQGLCESSTYEYLHSRISDVKYLGDRLIEAGIPIVKPVGGHAVFIDGRKFYEGIIPEDQFPAQTLVVYLYMEAGIRAVEIGSLLKGRDPVTDENIRPALDLVRLTIPRRKYSKMHYDVIVNALKTLYENKHQAKGMEVIRETEPKDGIRHFVAKLRFIEKAFVN